MGLTRSKEEMREGLKRQIQEFNGRLQASLLRCRQAKVTFITLSEIWEESRTEVIETLKTVADEIDRHHHNVNIASLTGTTSSIAGGTAAIGGLILSPFSGGLSLALCAGGLMGTVAGSATTLGANIAEVYLTKDLTERASKVLEADAFYTRALSAAFREIIAQEQEVVGILVELENETLLEDLSKVLQASSCCDEALKRRFGHLRQGHNSMQDILVLVKCLYPEDSAFLQQLDKTDRLFGNAPTLSGTLSSSGSGFFQAMKELTTLGPETLKHISGAALQSTAASSAQAASLTTQMLTVGLGAVFVALDIYQFLKTSENFDQGSKTELAQRMKDVADDMAKELQHIRTINEFYGKQVVVDTLSDSAPMSE